jgi:hypothetical protein
VSTFQLGSTESLDDAECRRLLATVHLGRLGYTDGALPAIVPVTFGVHDGSAIIPAVRDGSLLAAVRGAVVALQADSFRDELGSGWSVTALGPTRAVRHPNAIAEIDAMHLFPAGTSAAHTYVTVQLTLVQGWRVGTSLTASGPSHRHPGPGPPAADGFRQSVQGA